VAKAKKQTFSLRDFLDSSTEGRAKTTFARTRRCTGRATRPTRSSMCKRASSRSASYRSTERKLWSRCTEKVSFSAKLPDRGYVLCFG
jgi:hypothetical protein